MARLLEKSEHFTDYSGHRIAVDSLKCRRRGGGGGGKCKCGDVMMLHVDRK